MSVSSARVGTPCAMPSSTMVAASSRDSASVFMNAPRADFDVEHQRAGALGELLAHDRAGDQRQRLDGAGDVAQRVDLAVGRRQLAGGEDRRADVGKAVARICAFDRFGGEARNRLELVQRAAGVPEAAAGRLRHRRAAGGDHGHQRQGDLVADPAGGVLVDGAVRRADR